MVETSSSDESRNGNEDHGPEERRYKVFCFLQPMTTRQALTFIVFSIANFCQAICVSLQAPFYPAEAERKGATATEYGLVFGVFELTVFIVSPICGRNINRIGAKRMFNIGILTTGSCSILFGLLDFIQNGTAFIALSFIVRSIEAVGNSAFLTAAFSIIAKEFPSQVATMFALLETFFGIGLIVGPCIGGFLYEWKGYIMPFALLGSILVGAAVVTFFLLPKNYDEEMSGHSNDKSIWKALKIPSITFAVLSILVASSSIGFLLTALEPQLRQFHLKPFIMGAMFVINGGSYALTAPVFGFLCDKILNPAIINHIGAVCIIIGFTFLGPAPFIPMDTHLGVCIFSLVIHGFGIGGMLVSSFTIAHKQAVKNGFEDNLDTYGLVSGLWTSTFALGAFVGPTLAGILMDHSGIRYATLFIVVFGIFFLAVSALFYTVKSIKQKRRRSGYEQLSGIEEPNNGYDALSTEDVGSPSRKRSPSIGYDSASGGGSGSSRTSPDTDLPSSGPSASTTRRVTTRPIVHASGSGSNQPAGRSSNPLSPKSPFRAGSVGLFGGIMGYSGRVGDEDGGNLEHEVPHEFYEPESGAPPRRNARARRSKATSQDG